MEWLKHLSEAIDYIEENIESNISYDRAANIACCSTYYFQRMFSYVSGITLSEYIRRRRMTNAALDIQEGKERITDIALRYGYSSSTSFNRAFHSVHNIAPSMAKKEGTILNLYAPLKFSISVTGDEGMKYKIESKEKIIVQGFKYQMTDSLDENFKLVPKFWLEAIDSPYFNAICDSDDDTHPNGILGIATNEENEHYYYIGASFKEKSSSSLDTFVIPSATWVIFESDGRFPDTIQSIYKRFITEWLPFSGYRYAGLPDIEVYPKSKVGLNHGHSEVWIAIEKE